MIAHSEALLSSQIPTPQAFAEMKEKLNKKLAPAEESQQVGSMDPSEVAPTVEVLPELVVETETTAYERQERPNASLLKGQRQLVQKGEEGQIRRLVEVDAQGKRTLRSTEVLKEAIPEITEVGTKEEQVSPTTDQSPLATSVKGEAASKQLPNTGVETDTDLVALGLLGVMSVYGLVALKKRED